MAIKWKVYEGLLFSNEGSASTTVFTVNVPILIEAPSGDDL